MINYKKNQILKMGNLSDCRIEQDAKLREDYDRKIDSLKLEIQELNDVHRKKEKERRKKKEEAPQKEQYDHESRIWCRELRKKNE